jgi:predicted  nucleic acid-binding Zn-ribbon protein
MRLFVAVLTLSVTLTAQTAETPTLTSEQMLRLEMFEMKAENINLKMAALQVEFAKLQAEASTFTETLKKPGYTLQRDPQTRQWIYIAEASPK